MTQKDQNVDMRQKYLTGERCGPEEGIEMEELSERPQRSGTKNMKIGTRSQTKNFEKFSIPVIKNGNPDSPPVLPGS